MPQDTKMHTAKEYEDFAGYLEIQRLELIDNLSVIDNAYTDDDLKKIALYGAAINSIRDAAKFKLEIDGR